MKRKEQKEFTKLVLFNSALELFKKQGFQNTTVLQITQHAGVAKGTFFNYFHSKESVLHTVGHSQINLLHSFYNEVLESERTIEDSLYRLFRFVAKHYEEYGPNLLLSIFHIMTVQKELHPSETEMMSEFRSILIVLIKEGQERGEFDENKDSAGIAKMIVNSFLGTLIYWVHHNEKESLPVLIMDVIESFITVLKTSTKKEITY